MELPAYMEAFDGVPGLLRCEFRRKAGQRRINFRRMQYNELINNSTCSFSEYCAGEYLRRDPLRSTTSAPKP